MKVTERYVVDRWPLTKVIFNQRNNVSCHGAVAEQEHVCGARDDSYGGYLSCRIRRISASSFDESGRCGFAGPGHSGKQRSIAKLGSIRVEGWLLSEIVAAGCCWKRGWTVR